MMEVVIKAAGWRYRSLETGRLVPVERGAVVDLALVEPEDVAKGRRTGAFIEPAKDGEESADAGGAPFDQGVGPLAEWLEKAKLNVNNTVKLAGGDAGKARMLIDAEPVATGGKPRAGVLKALAQVIVRAEEMGDDEPAAESEDAAPGDDSTAEPGEGDADDDENEEE